MSCFVWPTVQRYSICKDNVWSFCLKNDLNDHSMLKIVVIFSVDGLIDESSNCCSSTLTVNLKETLK